MITDVCRRNLLAVVKAYCDSTEPPHERREGENARDYRARHERHVSMIVYGNQQFLGDFRVGSKSLTLEKYDLVLAKFREIWPKEAQWPDLEPIIFPAPQN